LTDQTIDQCSELQLGLGSALRRTVGEAGHVPLGAALQAVIGLAAGGISVEALHLEFIAISPAPIWVGGPVLRATACEAVGESRVVRPGIRIGSILAGP
jgi:hypothetical protein